LIDAPCSGLGVLKEILIKWKLRPEFIDNIRKVQSEVPESYSKIVKPGGRLVYATCSIPSENQEQVARFLTTDIGKEFNFIKDQKLASESGFDGFTWLLERKEQVLKN
jgi:16S rRNA (cytosine967-C5)-methyltransferase